MNCSIFSFSSKLAFIHAFLLLFLTCFIYLNTVSCTATELSYGVNCNSVVHESKPGDEEFNVTPFPERPNGYYSGGDTFLNISSSSTYYPHESKVLTFETHHVYATNVEDVFKVEGNMIFQASHIYEGSFKYDRSSYSYSGYATERGVVDFDFRGFWSRESGKLCMVGSTRTKSKEGKLLHLAAVLKLYNLKDSSINTLVTGTMDSLYAVGEPNYFDQVSLMMLPQLSYKYTLVSKEFSLGCGGGTDVPEQSSLSLTRTRNICDMVRGEAHAFELQYGNGCESSKSCNPVGDDSIGYMPQFMHWRRIQCSEDKLSLRFLIEFSSSGHSWYYPSSNLSNSLVGEGFWDAKKNRLCVAACRIYAGSSSLEKFRVRDCTTRLSLRFPAILSIRNTSTVVGEMWSEKPSNESGFFDRIAFQKADHSWNGIQLQGLKYEYMENGKVEESCPTKQSTKNNRGKYADAYSGDMEFRISALKDIKETNGWGSAKPLAVGDQPHQKFPNLIPSSSSRPLDSGKESDTDGSLLKISYKISISQQSRTESDSSLNIFNFSSNGELQISAEGVYDNETGTLCMVGCRYLRPDNKTSLSQSMDCEVLVNIQFPSLNSDRNADKVEGRIKSLREITDPLYFRPLEIRGIANYGSWGRESIWRMDFEMIMSVISNTLAFIFVALQIFHVRKHRGASPFISLLMLLVLALGHLIPLVLNLEAMFTQDTSRGVMFRGGIWLEMNEVIVRVVTMVAFLLQIRLLMLSWTARCSDEKKKALWTTEKRGFYVCFSVYIAGGLIAYHVASRRQPSYYREREQIILELLRAYSGLVLDAFLFPQVIFNMFQNSKEHALSRFFYIGLTLVRQLPHGYDLYRSHNFVDINDSYIYADRRADYFSTAWDLIIPVLGISFAAIIHFQQRLGGRCFLPSRFQESVTYEELPMDSEDQLSLKF